VGELVVASKFKVVDARWTAQVNMLKVRCPNCSNEFETRADRFNAKCPRCNQRGQVKKDLAG